MAKDSCDRYGLTQEKFYKLILITNCWDKSETWLLIIFIVYQSIFLFKLIRKDLVQNNKSEPYWYVKTWHKSSTSTGRYKALYVLKEEYHDITTICKLPCSKLKYLNISGKIRSLICWVLTEISAFFKQIERRRLWDSRARKEIPYQWKRWG
jgi:hypothetical protein